MKRVEYATPEAPARKSPPRKIQAYKRHWRAVHGLRDELSRQYIHNNIKLGKVAVDAQLSHQTVQRFFHSGRGNGSMGYSLFHGPATTTLVGIASALGVELYVRKTRQ